MERTNTPAHNPANIITIHRPTLTPEERAKRLGQIKTAAEKLLIATIHNKRKVNA